MNKLDQRVEEFVKGNITASDEFKQALTQTRTEAFDEALELVGEDKDCGIYKNKKTGKCRVCDYTPEMREGYNQAKAELREALQAKRDDV